MHTHYGDLSTTQLLQSWHRNGDDAALNAVFLRHEDWLRGHVRSRLGPALRKRLESGDIVQEAVRRFLADGPRVIAGQAQFLRLLAIIVENTICDQDDFFRRHRRSMSREQALPEGDVLSFDRRRPTERSPESVFEDRERCAALRLAFELMRPDDRKICLLHDRDRLTHAQIAEIFGINPGAANARYLRARVRLHRAVRLIKQRDIEALLAEFEGPLSPFDGTTEHTD